jgi:acylphosphatase
MNADKTKALLSYPRSSAFISGLYFLVSPLMRRSGCTALHVILSSEMGSKEKDARRWLVRGRVQGVGYRDFTQRAATALGLTGYARNLDDGNVEVYAVGPVEKLEELGGKLRHGPRWSDVWGVEEQEAAVQDYGRFRIVA